MQHIHVFNVIIKKKHPVRILIKIAQVFNIFFIIH